MKLYDLLKGVKVLNSGFENKEVVKVEFDSRKIKTDTLFVATVGTVADGHDYISKAVEAGAAAIVCERMPQQQTGSVAYVVVENSAEALGMIADNFYGNPSRQLTLVGVTGTNGKTTIATLLYDLFTKLGYKTGLLSTVVNRIADKSVPSTHTTPDALELNSLLTQMVEAGCEYAFMEVSSHSIDQRRIAGLDFNGAIFTNLTRDHMDYHKTFDNYLKAKKRLFDDLGNEAFALVNSDDKNGMVMLQNCKAEKKTYSVRGMADYTARILEDSFEGMQMNISSYEVFMPFVGRFNAYNLCAVFGAARELGVEASEILRILSSLKPVSGRFETLRSPSGYTAIVDYAHTPDALTNVISTINEIRGGQGKLITVVGCGGNRDAGKRPMMAREAVNGSDKVILTDDNPRFEESAKILDDMVAGLDAVQMKKVLVIADRRSAIHTACSMAQNGDVVLVAGKGHENYQIIGDVKHHFDDKEEILACF